MLQSMGLQRVRHDLAPEQQQQYIYIYTERFLLKNWRLTSSGGLVSPKSTEQAGKLETLERFMSQVKFEKSE